MENSTETGPTALADGTAASTAWHAWHLHLGSTARTVYDRVITHVIGPAVASVQGRPWFFIRYWQAGPHLRLRVGDLDEETLARVEELLRRRLETAGRLTRDERPVSQSSYARIAEQLAAGEQEQDRFVQDLLIPGVHRAVYAPEFARYGGRELMPYTERLFQLSSELVLALMQHVSRQGARSALALRATVCAAAAIGDTTEQAHFYAHGFQAWRSWAAEYGQVSIEQLDQLSRVSHGEGTAGGPASGKSIDPASHGPFGHWHSAIGDLCHELRHRTSMHPGQVVFSHVHMLHNRLGLSLFDELRTYAWLTDAFPTGESSEQGRN
ncbi:thiopeptide-type bacteriocin biosynthesis protein [Streptomyces afghaniensis]|uniref:thiopeptide-type bacteriocin biosynthesis protein n=1 Tax=Streptomyces afghaniensis TaxID=66865 RepID=UPI0033A5B9D4